jgi:hypothetical protein
MVVLPLRGPSIVGIPGPAADPQTSARIGLAIAPFTKSSSPETCAQDTIPAKLIGGGPVKKIRTCVGFVILCLTLSGPPIASVATESAQTKQQNDLQKQWKKHNQQEAKAQKKQLKAQNKAMKKWKSSTQRPRPPA